MLHNTVGLQRELGLNNMFIPAKKINPKQANKQTKNPRKNYSYSTHLPLQKSTGKHRVHKAGQHHQNDFKLMHAPHPMQSTLRASERQFFLKWASKILEPLFLFKIQLTQLEFLSLF